MRAGRTRLTALSCLFGLLAVVGGRPLAPTRYTPAPSHGLHLAAAVSIPVAGHQRVDPQLVLPARSHLPLQHDRYATARAAAVLPLRALVPAVARGPPAASA